MKDTMVKSYECPICHEEITAEKLVILPEDEHELHEELLGNIGDHMFSCHEAKRTPDAEQLKARIAELEAENAKLEKLNSAALERLSYHACPSNRNNYGQPCNDSDDCVACWREYLGDKDV